MELEELRQRLFLRSKSADIPPVANPVQISEVALNQAATKLKWDTTLSPAEIAARLGISAAKVENSSAGTTNGAAVPVAPQAQPASILAGKVEQLSEPTEAFREHLANLGNQLEAIDAAAQSAEKALKCVAGLADHLSSLASNFHSVKAFAEQVKTLSASFEPMKSLNAQLDQVTQALYANVKEVGAALTPVKSLQGKVRRLMTALDSIDKLEEQVSALADAFRSAPTTPAQSAPPPEKSVQAA